MHDRSPTLPPSSSPCARSDGVPVPAGLDASRTAATVAPASWLVEEVEEGRPEAARTP